MTHQAILAIFTSIILILSGCAPKTEEARDMLPTQDPSPIAPVQVPTSVADVLIPAPGSPVSVPFSPGGVDIGDLDNDGIPDLVVRGSDAFALFVLMGVGDGQLRAASSSPIQLREPASEFALGDINNDGWLDVVLGSHDSYRIELLLGDGAGSFSPAPQPFFAMKDGPHPHTHGLALGDVNNDGHLDLVTGNTTDGDVAVALGDGQGDFTRAAGSPFSVGKGPYPLALGDLNGDGNLDIAVTSTLNAGGPSAESLTVLFGDGLGGFRRIQVPVKTVDPWFVAIGDINGDRLADLVSSHWESSRLTVLTGNGNETFSEVPGSPFNLGNATWYFSIADMDGDGHADIITASDNSVRLLLGDGEGGFRPDPRSPYPTGGGSWRLATGDLNGDGRVDVVTSDLTGNSVTVLLAR